ncbi:HDOD domain-containing protein [Desulfospira joergensenii]|uniref:HDOD domain-containing protein n=1 Tax=Desulfospira joergensenii TaxID=53329 RepID=UPI0003B74ABA|nr:HDOD domain-containing protein [Desulfospira joergensenii]
MGESKIPHSGIELDAIDLSNLNPQSPGKDPGKIPSNPDDYRIFVNGMLKKMKGQESFLSFSRQLNDVNQILVMKYSSAQDIADVILKDMALTSKVLKLVNSSFYRHFSSKGISTISEAMIILGTDEIRSLAASIKIYEMMQEMANSRILKEMTLKGLQRSIMARQMADEGGFRDPDVIQISAMIHDFGEYLVVLLAPEKYIQVELVMEAKGMDQQEAAKSVLGLTYTDLGRIVASKLNMPENIVQTMLPFTRKNMQNESMTREEEQRCICSFTRELCDIPMNGQGNETDQETGYVAARYNRLLGVDLPKALELIRTSREKLAKNASLWQIEIQEEEGAGTSSSSGVKEKAALKDGLKSLKHSLDTKRDIHETLTQILDLLFTNFYFTQVAICIRQKETPSMQARYAKGGRFERLLDNLSFEFARSEDVFSDAVLKKKDIVVRDIQGKKYKSRIPEWYTQKIMADNNISGFAVFPVQVNNRDIALIYVSWKDAALAMTRKTTEYLQLIRELMAKAFVRCSRSAGP